MLVCSQYAGNLFGTSAPKRSRLYSYRKYYGRVLVVLMFLDNEVVTVNKSIMALLLSAVTIEDLTFAHDTHALTPFVVLVFRNRVNSHPLWYLVVHVACKY
jgi:hypothetical protein